MVELKKLGATVVEIDLPTSDRCARLLCDCPGGVLIQPVAF
jgi:hypothetical protein